MNINKSMHHSSKTASKRLDNAKVASAKCFQPIIHIYGTWAGVNSLIIGRFHPKVMLGYVINKVIDFSQHYQYQ